MPKALIEGQNKGISIIRLISIEFGKTMPRRNAPDEAS
jgi:hypothetical protein